MKFNIDSIQIQKVSSFSRYSEPKKHHNKLYICPSNESVVDNFLNRHNRPYEIYKKDLLPMVMDKIKTDYPKEYETIKNTKWSWSQNCGCSACPCSPGFISDKRTIDFIVYDIHVNVQITN